MLKLVIRAAVAVGALSAIPASADSPLVGIVSISAAHGAAAAHLAD